MSFSSISHATSWWSEVWETVLRIGLRNWMRLNEGIRRTGRTGWMGRAFVNSPDQLTFLALHAGSFFSKLHFQGCSAINYPKKGRCLEREHPNMMCTQLNWRWDAKNAYFCKMQQNWPTISIFHLKREKECWITNCNSPFPYRRS